MPLDPDKVRQAVEKADSLTKRFDTFLARRAKRDADKVQRKADRDFETRRDADAPPTKPDRTLEQPRDLPDPWYYTDLELGYEREELRQGGLSKERI
jgi:hypothetical protein